MNAHLRMMSDRQTMLLTLPDFKFDSLQQQNLAKLEMLFRKMGEQVTGKTLILDVSRVRSAGAGFLTEVNRFASVLGVRQVKLVIAGDVGGLLKLVGWQRRFLCYSSVLDALMAWPEWCLPAAADNSTAAATPANQVRPAMPLYACSSCRNGMCVCRKGSGDVELAIDLGVVS
jgi:hypothetical protein